MIGRALTDGADDAMFGHRHRLLQAWTRMQDGQLPSAAADVAAVAADGLHRRDALWMAALQTAIARRTGDSGALSKHFFTGLDVLAEYSIDLFCLLPLGELWVAAARLRQTDRLSYALDQAFGLLTALGDPPAWSLPLHWAGVHAAILANSPESMAPHGQALTAAAESNGFAAALAGAGRSWLRVLARQVDVDEVAAAARGLAQFGLTWDATRLAGQAALQAPDPRVSGAMLQIARDLKLTTDTPDLPDEPGAAEPGGTAPPGRPAGRRCPSGNVRSPNYSCSACPTATSARNCSSRPRPSSITWPGSGGDWAPNRGQKCCRCCARCSLRKVETYTTFRWKLGQASVAALIGGMSL